MSARSCASAPEAVGDLLKRTHGHLVVSKYRLRQADGIQLVRTNREERKQTDLEAVKVLSAAPAVLDLFMWLSYRCFFAKGAESIPIFGEYGLARQLGSVDYSRPRRFRAMLDQWQFQLVIGRFDPSRPSALLGNIEFFISIGYRRFRVQNGREALECRREQLCDIAPRGCRFEGCKLGHGSIKDPQALLRA
jgi:hypothetical protein